MASLQEIHSQSYADMPFDDFAKRYHQKFYSDMPYDAFMQKAGTPATPKERTVENVAADPIKEEVRGELEKLRAKGVKISDSATRQYLQGATFGAADEILAGLQTPIEMIARRTLDPVKAYNYAKAREDLILENTRKDNGVLGTGMELAGGLTTGTGAAKAGATFMKEGAGVLNNAGRMAADGVVYGALTGFNEGSGVEGRLKGAATGGVVGGLAGGGIGLAAPVVSSVGRNTLGWISANADPEKYASKQLARALSESGKTPQQLAQEIADANAAGQPFTLADAMGNSGQRMLSVVARNPGQGRTDVVEFLNGRQVDQAGRVGSMIDDALGASTTGRQTQRALMKQAKEEAGPLYEQALSREFVWTPRIQQFLDDPIAQQGISKGMAIQRLEAVAEGKPFNPKDYGVVDFDAAGNNITMGVPNMRTLNVLKKGIDDILEGYRDPTTGKLVLDEYGRAVDMYRRSLVEQLKKANPDYAKALETWSGPASVSEAVGLGRQAATRGRAADNIDTFNAMGVPQQGGYRIGYADAANAGIERARETANVAGRFTSPKSKAELEALSLYQGPRLPGEGDQLAKGLRRENTMFETRNQALGGSKTADNLADSASVGVSPDVLIDVLKGGSVMNAVKSIVNRSSDVLSGNTAEVRQKLAQALLNRSANPKQIETVLQKVIDDKAQRDAIVRALLSGSIGGGATGVNAAKR